MVSAHFAKEAIMAAPNVDLWKQAINKMVEDERAEAQRQLQAMLEAEKKAAEEKAKKEAEEKAFKEMQEAEIEAAAIELQQFLDSEAGAYAKTLCEKNNVFLPLARTRDNDILAFDSRGFFCGKSSYFSRDGFEFERFERYSDDYRRDERWDLGTKAIVEIMKYRHHQVSTICRNIFKNFDNLANQILKK
jgi:hypothetical protein